MFGFGAKIKQTFNMSPDFLKNIKAGEKRAGPLFSGNRRKTLTLLFPADAKSARLNWQEKMAEHQLESRTG